MSPAGLQCTLERPAPLSISGHFRFTYVEPVSSREVLFVCVFLTFIQILDGVLTGIGVSLYGTGAEGNPFVRILMENMGSVEALCFIKTVAIIIIAALFYLSVQVTWVARALKGLVFLYLVAAIFPWTVILLREAIKVS